MKKYDEIISALLFAAKGRTTAEGPNPWDYGWCFEEYRRSSEASIAHDAESAVRLTPEGVRAYETAMHHLLKNSDIANRWDAEELWGVVASLIATLPIRDDDVPLRTEIDRRVALLQSEWSFVAFPVANIRWETAPLLVAQLIIGRSGADWMRLVSESANGRPSLRETDTMWWLSDKQGPGAVAVATWANHLRGKAVQVAKKRFDQIVEVTLMMELDLNAREIWSGRGSLTRPGVRGLVIDRQRLFDRKLELPETISRELSTTFLVRDKLGGSKPTHWSDGEPFPLDSLLSSPKRQELVNRVLTTSAPIFERIKLAAKWHGRAHWSGDSEEAVLSLGVAFDALLGAENGPQRREISERFALLEPDPTKRETAYRLFSEVYYTARSEVAHGSPCSALEKPNFIREMSAALRAKAYQVCELAIDKSILSEQDYASVFKQIKWGTIGSTK